MAGIYSNLDMTKVIYKAYVSEKSCKLICVTV